MYVYILTTEPNSSKVQGIRNLFVEPEFLVLTKTPELLNIRASNDQLRNHQIGEISSFMAALNEAPFNQDIIILKDNITTNLTATEIGTVIRSIQRYPNFDICYLCRWLDRCDLLSDEVEIPGSMLKLARTQMPNGSLALYVSKQGRGKLSTSSIFDPYANTLSVGLTSQIVQGHINSIATVPNLFHYDYLDARNKIDYVKTHECRTPPNSVPPLFKEPLTTISFLWFILIVLGIIVIAYFVLRTPGPV